MLYPVTGEIELVSMDRDAFAEAVRLPLHRLETNRRLPLLLARAHDGDLDELAQGTLAQTGGSEA